MNAAPLYLLMLPMIVVFLVFAAALYWPTRFSLRGMLIFVTLLSVVFGLLAVLARWPK